MKSASVLLMACGLAAAGSSSASQCNDGHATVSIDYHSHVDRSPKPGQNQPDLSTEFYRATVRVALAEDYVPPYGIYLIDEEDPNLQVQIANMKPTYLQLVLDFSKSCMVYKSFKTDSPSETGLVRFNGANQYEPPQLCFESARQGVMKVDFEIRSNAANTPKPLQAKDLRVFLLMKRLSDGKWVYLFDTAKPCAA